MSNPIFIALCCFQCFLKNATFFVFIQKIIISFRTSNNTSDVRMLVFDSIVDIFFFIDIIFNFHTSFVGNNGEVITDETVIRRHYLKVLKQFIL